MVDVDAKMGFSQWVDLGLSHRAAKTVQKALSHRLNRFNKYGSLEREPISIREASTFSIEELCEIKNCGIVTASEIVNFLKAYSAESLALAAEPTQIERIELHLKRIVELLEMEMGIPQAEKK